MPFSDLAKHAKRISLGNTDAGTCEFCCHWQGAKAQGGDDGGAKYGICRRFPPQMHARAIFLVPPHPQAGRAAIGQDGQPIVQPIPLWAVTAAVEKCGEWKS